MALFSLGARFKEMVSVSSIHSMSRVEMDNVMDLDDALSVSSIDSATSGEFSDLNASSYISMLSNLIWSPRTCDSEQPADADEIWVPDDPEAIAQVPELMLFNYKRVHPAKESEKNGSFAVYVYRPDTGSSADVPSQTSSGRNSPSTLDTSRPSTPGSEISSVSKKASTVSVPVVPTTHHLMFRFWKGSTERIHALSLFRSNKVTDVIALCERCRECSDLFRVNGVKGGVNQEFIGTLLEALREHVLWKSVHIASYLGLTTYFKQGSRKLRCSLCLCQPEGMSPFMIAVQNDRLELVKYFLETGFDVSGLSTIVHNNLLHFAASASADMVKLLMDSGKCDQLMNMPNAAGSTPLYLAVMNANGFCARALRAYGATLTPPSSVKKSTPLLDAMRKPKMDVCTMQAIFDSCPDALEEVEPVSGNTALHCAAFKKPLLALLELKSDELHVDRRNSLMQTALHVFVQKGELSLVMAVVAYNADLNVKDNTGNTPLHLAVSALNIEMVRALLCLGALPNIVNNHKETPRHMAAKFKNNDVAINIVRSLILCGAQTCKSTFVGCAVGCVHKDNFIGEPIPKNTSNLFDETRSEDDNVARVAVNPEAPTGAYEFELDPESQLLDEAYSAPNPVRNFPQKVAIDKVLSAIRQCAEEKKEHNFVCLLSLDGGGIKGLVMTQILLSLQKYLNAPVFSYFDWIAGTSTGSYVASALAIGKSLRDCQRIYLRFKDVLFDAWSRPYNTLVLEDFIRKTYGESTTMADVKYPRLFFTTVRADKFPVQLELLRNYQLPLSPDDNKALGFENPEDLPVWLATRRSSAAPTYFSASEGKFIDGGMVSNNPTLDLLSEVTFWNSTCQYSNKPEHMVEIGCVVSIGTGITPISPVDPTLFEMSDMFGLVRGIKNLSLMVLDQATATEGAPISRSRSWCHSHGAPYFRLNAPLFKDVMMDSKEDSELVKIMWDTVVYAHTHRKDFEDLANILTAMGTNKRRKKQAL